MKTNVTRLTAAALLFLGAPQAMAFLGGFEQGDGYRDVFFAPRSGVQWYNAGMFSSGSGTTYAAPSTAVAPQGLWARHGVPSQYDKDFMGPETPKSYVTGHSAYDRVWVNSSGTSGSTEDQALMITTEALGWSNPALEYRYQFEAADLGVSPAATSDKVVNLSFWWCADLPGINEVFEGKGLGGQIPEGYFGHSIQFMDSSGTVGFTLGLTQRKNPDNSAADKVTFWNGTSLFESAIVGALGHYDRWEISMNIAAGTVSATYVSFNKATQTETPQVLFTDVPMQGAMANLSQMHIKSSPGVDIMKVFSIDDFTFETQEASGPCALTVTLPGVSPCGSCPSLVVSPASLPSGTVGVPYSQVISTSGGTAPYSYSITSGSLPSGLTLNGGTGAITGTPLSAGTYPVTIGVTDSLGCPGSTTLSVSIQSAGCPVVVVTPNPLPNGTVGLAYSANPSASPAASYTWTAVGLPAGLTLDSSTGAITGTPTEAGFATITATYDIKGEVCSGTTTLTVACPLITISPSQLPGGIVGTPYTASLSATGGSTPYTWTSTPLPGGLSLNASTGALSGTPTASGTATITVTDTNGCTRSIPLKVVDPISTICITPDPKQPEIINIVFTRDPDITGIDYCIEYTDILGNPTIWREIPIEVTSYPINILPDGTEEITITNIEELTGLAEGEGYVRLIAKDNGTPIKESSVQGWKQTVLGLCCQTYNMPFQRCATFTGTVSAVSGQGLIFTGENLSDLLVPEVSYYAEVISGDNAGQRFDVVSAAGTTATLASDSDLCAATAPFNTLTGAPPANLAGDTVAIRPHWTIAEVFPPAAFGATNDQTTADQIQIHAGGTWKIYWLYDNGASPIWVDTADAGLNDQGNAVLPPGQGVFFNNRTAPAKILGYGEVRENPFIRPLCAGLNLVGGGYPVTESTALRGMTNSNFFGSTNFSTADNILIWNNDATQSNTNNYTTRWLLNHTNPFKRWVKIGDSTFTAEDANLIFPGNRASFIRRATARPTFSYPATWSP